jgi:hypothetical protein
MNRRQFCLRAFTVAVFADVTSRYAPAQEAAPDVSEDVYAIWSVLIPLLQPHPGLGYMITDQTAVPDSLPYLYVETEPPKSPVENAKEAADAPYATVVPDEFRTSFSQALAEAQKLKENTTRITHRFELKKQYRLLSESDLESFLELNPAIHSAGWKPDERIASQYKGWNAASSLSRPYFDQSRQLALIWAGTHASCFDKAWYFFKKNGLQWDNLNWRTSARSECD